MPRRIQFVRLQNNNWGVSIPLDAHARAGQWVEVTRRDGSTQTVQLAERVDVDYGRAVHRIVPRRMQILGGALAAANA